MHPTAAGTHFKKPQSRKYEQSWSLNWREKEPSTRNLVFCRCVWKYKKSGQHAFLSISSSGLTAIKQSEKQTPALLPQPPQGKGWFCNPPACANSPMEEKGTTDTGHWSSCPKQVLLCEHIPTLWSLTCLTAPHHIGCSFSKLRFQTNNQNHKTPTHLGT